MAASQSATVKSVEAQGFLLKDGAGNVRVALHMKGDRSVQELYASFGRAILIAMAPRNDNALYDVTQRTCTYGPVKTLM
ncbi:MAG: hypothetical protein DMG30_04230 [Acidobacteria bacterium]|nr:MAG: hypothetical protein DMG30_04230 [Acidobacteriota bacterium]